MSLILSIYKCPDPSCPSCLQSMAYFTTLRDDYFKQCPQDSMDDLAFSLLKECIRLSNSLHEVNEHSDECQTILAESNAIANELQAELTKSQSETKKLQDELTKVRSELTNLKTGPNQLEAIKFLLQSEKETKTPKKKSGKSNPQVSPQGSPQASPQSLKASPQASPQASHQSLKASPQSLKASPQASPQDLRTLYESQMQSIKASNQDLRTLYDSQIQSFQADNALQQDLITLCRSQIEAFEASHETLSSENGYLSELATLSTMIRSTNGTQATAEDMTAQFSASAANPKYIYIVELLRTLADGTTETKYYVGKTTRKEGRDHEHRTLTDWKTYFGIGTYVVKEINFYLGDDYDEDKTCIRMMAQHGINNVRGGSFCIQVISKKICSVITQMILTSTDCCFICRTPGHFANVCRYRAVHP